MMNGNIPEEYRGDFVVAFYQAKTNDYYVAIQATQNHPADLEGRRGIGDRLIKAFPNTNMGFWSIAMDLADKMTEQNSNDDQVTLKNILDQEKK